MSGRRALLGLLLAVPLPLRAQGVPPLSEAQRLLFETPHLAALRPPLRLDYAFLREEAGREPVRDLIRLQVTAATDPERRDVAVDFLTGPRAIRYPPARGFRGNPLLLFALDRDTRELSAATGGTQGWFRNRMRQALLDPAGLRRIDMPFEGGAVPATEITLLPFDGEPRAGRFQRRRYRFVLAEAVPGWLAMIASDTPGAGPDGRLIEEIAFQAASPEGAG